MKDLVHEKHLEQCLVHREHLIGTNSYYPLSSAHTPIRDDLCPSEGGNAYSSHCIPGAQQVSWFPSTEKVLRIWKP